MSPLHRGQRQRAWPGGAHAPEERQGRDGLPRLEEVRELVVGEDGGRGFLEVVGGAEEAQDAFCGRAREARGRTDGQGAARRDVPVLAGFVRARCAMVATGRPTVSSTPGAARMSAMPVSAIKLNAAGF